jgi:hypothetical protein
MTPRAILTLYAFLSPIQAESLLAQPIAPLNITPTAAGEFLLGWKAGLDERLQMEGSSDCCHWEKVGQVFLGTGAPQSMEVSNAATRYFYKLTRGELRPGFDQIPMGRWDDHTYPQYSQAGIEGEALPVDLGFTINFFGELFSDCFVNNNGNISFGSSYGIFTPEPLRHLGKKIIAPFWADVDTSNAESNVVRFNSGTIDGHPAFGVTYQNVGYYNSQSDKLNSFQVLIIERSDTGAYNFDIEFNYEKVRWESGDASQGTKGFGGSTARAGVTNGGSFSVEIDGSGIPSAFLDHDRVSGAPNLSQGLVYQAHNSNVPGRFIFPVRNGALEGTFRVEAGPLQQLPAAHSSTVQLQGSVFPPDLTGLTYRWVQKDDLAPVTFSNPTILNPTVTLAEPGHHVFELTVSSSSLTRFSVSDEVEITHAAHLQVDAGPAVFRNFPDAFEVTLMGSASYSGGGPVSVRWSQEYGEPADIENPTALEPTVTLPGPGYYGFKLEATAGRGPFTRSSETTVNYQQE